MDHDKPPTRAIWNRLGGQLGVGLCAVGFILVFLGWNGAASVDRLPSQFPYLLSGGVAGLCFVVVGVGMIVVQNQRADRAALQATLRELREALADAGLAQAVDTDRKPFRKPGPRPAPLGDDPTDHAFEDVAIEPAAAPRSGRSRSTPLTAAGDGRTAAKH